MGHGIFSTRRAFALALALPLAFAGSATAQAPPEVVDPGLRVRAEVSGLNQPVSIAFLGT